MARYFDPQLVNGPFDDPALFVDLVFERRALLFDLGDISALAPRKLLRLAYIFISHRHMDHFIGFDRLLRCLLGRQKVLGIWGPSGLINAVENKISAYDWNVVEGYDGNLQLHVSELALDGRVVSAKFCGANRFRREDLGCTHCQDGVIVSDRGFTVKASHLEHGIPVLGYSVQERARINIWRNRVEAAGLAVGPWLNEFKNAILAGEEDSASIEVQWSVEDGSRPKYLHLGWLKSRIMKVTKGRKIAYVVDSAFTEGNQKAIVSLAQDADILFIEAAFLGKDAEHAAARNHLTAEQAGTLARRANVQQLKTFHYSSRYRGREREIVEEADAAFHGLQLQAPDQVKFMTLPD